MAPPARRESDARGARAARTLAVAATAAPAPAAARSAPARQRHRHTAQVPSKPVDASRAGRHEAAGTILRLRRCR